MLQPAPSRGTPETSSRATRRSGRGPPSRAGSRTSSRSGAGSRSRSARRRPERVVGREARQRFLIAVRADLDLVEPHAPRGFGTGAVDAAERVVRFHGVHLADRDRVGEGDDLLLELVRQDHEEVVAGIEPHAGQHHVVHFHRYAGFKLRLVDLERIRARRRRRLIAIGIADRQRLVGDVHFDDGSGQQSKPGFRRARARRHRRPWTR